MSDATPAVETPAQPAPPASDAVVDAWFAETFHGLPLATDYFNRFRAAAEELKKRLAALGG